MFHRFNDKNQQKASIERFYQVLGIAQRAYYDW